MTLMLILCVFLLARSVGFIRIIAAAPPPGSGNANIKLLEQLANLQMPTTEH